MSVANIDTHVDLVINRMSRQIYDHLKALSSISEDQLYLIDEDNLNAENLRILNVANPELSDDAANKAYVDALSNEYQPKGEYLTSHQSLSNYYTKSETNGLSTSFREGLALSATTLSGYGITDAKIDNGTITLGTSSITPLTAVPLEYKTYSDTLSSLSANGYVMDDLLNTISGLLSTAILNKVTLKIWADDDPIE